MAEVCAIDVWGIQPVAYFGINQHFDISILHTQGSLSANGGA
ncbi:hypothetical protein OCK74_09765 [Chitinophagaceae bacterium LB-8]|uniref:Uncharacterized protein n=1 Tax=Paraflavisolibacter caeni TaxID=2982496 RepID=A0A9X2XUN8_9BACT|nr:hypothetical protein [Paraflavisolibacter caeni]MCU7549401.1 hypothetical protein [Paraflavisolibacter caeni]